MFLSKIVYQHDIPSELIINLDHTPWSYISPGKFTFNIKDAKKVPVKGIGDKRQITATLAVSAVGHFLPLPLKMPPKLWFPKWLQHDIGPTWGEPLSIFKTSFFHSFRKPKTNIVAPNEQTFLVIMENHFERSRLQGFERVMCKNFVWGCDCSA